MNIGRIELEKKVLNKRVCIYCKEQEYGEVPCGKCIEYR